MLIGRLTNGRFSPWPNTFLDHMGILTNARFASFIPEPKFGGIPYPDKKREIDEDLLCFIETIVCSGILN